MKRKIAMLLPELGGGGAERVFLLLAEFLADNGIEVDLILMKKQGEYLSELPGNIRVVSLCTGSDGKFHLWEAGIAFLQMLRYLRETSIDVLFSTLGKTNLFAILSALMASENFRLIIREANTFHNISSKIQIKLAAWLYPKADHIIAISKGVAQDLRRIKKIKAGNVSVIYNPIDLKKIQLLSKAPMDHPWLLSKTVPVIVAVGRLAPQKDFETLIHAFDKVQKKLDARLIILGKGPLKKKLEGMIQELSLEKKVRLEGFKRNPFPYYRHADLFVMSSRWEGFGMVLIEAMACGTNIVSTDCHSGPAEILDSGQYGCLVPVGDNMALSRAILKTLKAPLRRQVLLKRSGFFTKDKICKNYYQILFPEEHK